jgi:hypothetical protein
MGIDTVPAEQRLKGFNDAQMDRIEKRAALVAK